MQHGYRQRFCEDRLTIDACTQFSWRAEGAKCSFDFIVTSYTALFRLVQRPEFIRRGMIYLGSEFRLDFQHKLSDLLLPLGGPSEDAIKNGFYLFLRHNRNIAPSSVSFQRVKK